MSSKTRPSRPSRRTFLSRSAATVGGFMLPAACGKPTQPVPVARERVPLGEGERVRIGVIGTGGMGGRHVEALLTLSEKGAESVDLVGLSDVCRQHLDEKLGWVRDRQSEEVRAHRDYEELLERDDIHAVLIATPEHWHGQMAVDAIAAGKDVYLEKPMTLRLDESLWLYETLRANPSVILQVGTQYVMLPKYRAARRLVGEGAIGHPTSSQTSYCRNSERGEWVAELDARIVPGEALDWRRWCGPAGVREWDPDLFISWRRYRDFSTGIVGDLLVHNIAPLVFALGAGWPVRVAAAGGHYVDKAMENHDQVNLLVEFDSDHTMTVAGSTCNEFGVEPMIRGHEANLFLGGSRCVLRPERIYSDSIDEQSVDGEHVDPHDELRLNWLHCIRTREVNESPAELGLKVMVIVDLATRSLWEGKAFRFDPETLEVAEA